ncbi:regulatory protein RecX [Alteromonas halophila]|uniref:Regulatory protein RecX n=1 Tax=Alteromonas halophila TaxID=516698 RepID=A0A918JCN6_9ALTE|nr:regulatory protein RecX [Alteromonas halophila]GGW73892.1 regulatory protein RecX [Alteromonas halophila]
MSEFDRNVIIDTITRMLARREHSVLEIEQKLRQKGVPESDFMPVVQEFVDNDIQSNLRYAEARTRAMASRGSGPVKIRGDLRQRGVDEADIERALDEADVDWYQLAFEVKCKKYGGALAQDYAQRMKQMQFLKYRGFAMVHIEYAVQGD